MTIKSLDCHGVYSVNIGYYWSICTSTLMSIFETGVEQYKGRFGNFYPIPRGSLFFWIGTLISKINKGVYTALGVKVDFTINVFHFFLYGELKKIPVQMMFQ